MDSESMTPSSASLASEAAVRSGSARATPKKLQEQPESSVEDYIRQAAADPRVQAAVRRQANSLAHDFAEQAQQNYCASFSVYGHFVFGRLPRLDTSMLSGHRVDWLEAFSNWNIVWMQMTLLLLAVYTILYWIWAFPNFLNMTKCLWKVVVSGLLAYMVGHLGWYMVRERNAWCGNIGYMALGVAYIAIEMWALSEMDEREQYENLRYVIAMNFIPLIYLEVCCWKLGCGVAARQLGSRFREQLATDGMELQLPPPARAPRPPRRSRESRDREPKDREAKDRAPRDRESRDRESRDREPKDREPKDREPKDRAPKDREPKEVGPNPFDPSEP